MDVPVGNGAEGGWRVLPATVPVFSASRTEQYFGRHQADCGKGKGKDNRK